MTAKFLPGGVVGCEPRAYRGRMIAFHDVAREILPERYASGELSRDEYRDRRAELG
jgi:uncharacterized membrane protein